MKVPKLVLMVFALLGVLVIASCTDSLAEDTELYENQEAVDYTTVKRPT